MSRANRNGNDAVPAWVKRANRESSTANPTNRITWPIGLDCHHTAYYISPIPAIGTEVYCRPCGRYALVVMHPPQWRIRCRNCTLSGVRESESESYRAASKHSMKRQDHTVDVFLGDEVKGSVGAAEDALMPYEREITGRQEQVRENARALRDAVSRYREQRL